MVFAGYSLALAHRGTLLLAALLVTVLAGWVLSPIDGINDRLIDKLEKLASSLARKLNRRQRDAATVAWRGVIVLAFFALPAIALGWFLDAKFAPLAFLVPFELMLLPLQPARMMALWRRAREKGIDLQIARPHFLFADAHGLLRNRIAYHAEGFVQAMGAAFWYVLGGSAFAFVFGVFSLLHWQYRDEPLFGAVVRPIFTAMDWLPRRISAVLLALAGLLVPGARSIHALPAGLSGDTPLFTARLIDASLGGPGPDGDQPWVGDGTPRLEAAHFGRWLLCWIIASLWLMVLGGALLILASH